MDLSEQGDEALVVDLLFLGFSGSPLRSFSSTLYMPVSVRPGCCCLLALAVRVEALAEIADALFEFAFFERGEGKLFKQSAWL